MPERRPTQVKNVEIESEESEDSLDDLISNCCTDIGKLSNTLQVLIDLTTKRGSSRKFIKKSSERPQRIKTEKLYEENFFKSDTQDNEQNSGQRNVKERKLDRFEILKNMRESACKRRVSESQAKRSQCLEDLRNRAAARRASETPAEREKRLKAMKLKAAKRRM